MQRHAQLVSQKQTVLDLGPMVSPTSESALRAAYVRLELSRFLSFEQAMADPAYAIGIRNLADAIARRESAERIADIFANDQPNYRLQFTQAFRAELRAVISAREREAADAS
jgi:hypothetical protein